MSGSLILVPKASAVKSLDELGGKTVAVIQGAIQDKDVEQLQPKAGRADAYVHDDIVILSLAKENADLKAVGKTFVPRPYGIAVRKGDTEFINWVNAELKKM